MSHLTHFMAWMDNEIEEATHGRVSQKLESDTVLPLPWDRSSDKSKGIRAVLVSDDPVGKCMRTVMKLYVPAMSSLAGDRRQASRGLLLGPAGTTIHTLTAESRCRLRLRGRGSGAESTTNTRPEDEEDLHLLVEYHGPAAGRRVALMYVDAMVRAVLCGGAVAPLPRPDLFSLPPAPHPPPASAAASALSFSTNFA